MQKIILCSTALRPPDTSVFKLPINLQHPQGPFRAFSDNPAELDAIGRNG